MNDNVINNTDETIKNLLDKYTKENGDLLSKVDDIITSQVKWDRNCRGHEGNLLEVLLYEYLREEEDSDKLLDDIDDKVGKIRFGNVIPSYDHKIKVMIPTEKQTSKDETESEVEEIENEGVSITSAPYKKYRAKNDIKFESIQYQEGEMNYYLIVIYDKGYKTELYQDGKHERIELPGVDLNNLDEVRDAMFSQLDLVLNRNRDLEEEIKDNEEVVEAVDGTIEEEMPTEEIKEQEVQEEKSEPVIKTDADDILMEGTASEEEEKDKPVMTDADDVLLESNYEAVKDEDKEPVITDADDVLLESNYEKVEEQEEYVPVVKEEVSEERVDIPFIPNELFKNRPEINISKLNEVKNEIAKDLRSNGIEEIEETMQPVEEVADEEAKVEETSEDNKEVESDEVPTSEIKEYDHEEDELGIDNPMVEDHTDDESLKEIKKIVEETSKEMNKDDEDLDR